MASLGAVMQGEPAPSPLPPLHTRHRRTPTILQHEAVECGAASLAMVLAYYGKFVPLEQLRIDCGVSRDGTKASNLLRAARQYGLLAKGYRKEPRALAEITLPAIIFWNFNHFVVLEGFKKGFALLNDPAQGRRTVSADEFDQSFTGVVLVFEKGPEFAVGGQAPSILRSLREFFQGMNKAVAWLVLLGLLLVLPGVLLPYLSSRFIDDVLVARDQNMVVMLLTGMALTALARATLTWLQNRYLSMTHARKAMDLASRFFWHTLSLPAVFFTQRSAGEISSRVGLNEGVAHTLAHDVSQGLLDILTAAFFLIAMFWYSVELSLIAVVAVSIELLVWRHISTTTAELSQQVSVKSGRVSAASVSGLSNIETIKAAGQEWGLYSKWLALQTQLVNTVAKVHSLSLTLGQLPGLLTLLVNLSILGLGSIRIINGQMTVGELVAYQTLLMGFSGPARALLSLNQRIVSLRGDISRLEDVLRYSPDESAASAAAEAPPIKLRGHLEVRNVSFGYNRNDPPLVQDFSLSIAPGKHVALVGGSGSGKSTIARLVMGLYQPWSGEILLDGKPRTQYAADEIAGSVSVVDQDVFLFQGTVRENLTMWDSTIDNDDVVAACKDACIHDVIVGRPGGYEATIAEGGRNLSGGQRQRLEIARALTRNPRLLVLDEATSALDPSTEHTVENNLRRRGCSCLIVAHRLSTVRDADEIVVLENGRIVERGTHQELLGQAGAYARLIAAEVAV